LLWRLGLGLLVGAVLQRPLGAQDTTAARDTTRQKAVADSLLRDSLARAALRDTAIARARRDTIKAPITRAAMPVSLEIGQSYVWDRAALFATGALTVSDLLDLVPGISDFRSGWIANPMNAAFLGDVRRVRVFLDGLEMDELDPTDGGILDLTEVQLWAFEELRIERGATEVRVYCRSWRVDRTTPFTRADISTGDQQTNLYRGYFGRRYSHGEAIQVGAQQFGTTPPIRGSPSSDELALLGRLGWAKRSFSFDAFAIKAHRHRGQIQGQEPTGQILSDNIPESDASRTDMYLRTSLGTPTLGPWLQLLAGAVSFKPNQENKGLTTTPGDTNPPPDSSLFRAQYVALGGFTRWGLEFSGAERLRVQDGKTLSTPSARLQFARGPIGLSAFAEGRGPDSISRAEAVVQLTPISFISLLGTAGRSSERLATGENLNTNFARAEAGLRVFGLWFVGGVVQRDSIRLGAPIIFDTNFVEVTDVKATGITGAIRGTIYGPIWTNVMLTRWDDSAAFYRPRWQSRNEIGIRTNWLSRFPSGNFGVNAAFLYEYQSGNRFPVSDNGNLAPISVGGFHVVSTRLEFRLLSAVLSYQFRNMWGEPYQVVPFFLMPRRIQFYGVRWEFWN
jgi:hypothetical protein